MDIDTYLDRIGLSDLPPATLQGLHLLQDHHMRAVPFENLDVLIGRPLDLSIDALFDKIVTRRRGGYCFELNTLYAELLRAMGFDAVPMMARVWYGRPDGTPPRTHLVYRLEIEGRTWVTDVGFGGRAARTPLLLTDERPVDDGDGLIRIQPDSNFGYRVARDVDGVWINQYSVETTPAPWSDILCGNHWTENHPSSKFRHGIGVGLFTREGRTSFYSGQFARRGQTKDVMPVTEYDAVIALLRTEFGLALDLNDAEQKRLQTVI